MIPEKFKPYLFLYLLLQKLSQMPAFTLNNSVLLPLLLSDINRILMPTEIQSKYVFEKNYSTNFDPENTIKTNQLTFSEVITEVAARLLKQDNRFS